MARRLPVTLADYAVVALNPALIMVLIASVAFFLAESFYGGDYEWRLTFILGMFVMGAVAVGRISMEEGTSYAALFAAPLALAALFALGRFVEFQGSLAGWSGFINLGLVLLILWLAYKLTWDCTLLDERADTSDRGLLHAVGVRDEAAAGELEAEEPAHPQPDDDATIEPREKSLWNRWFSRGKQPHAHGVWVVYFTLIALPTFGLGQFMLSESSRSYAFFLLVSYLVSTFGLLLSTSFLGLRRYLRKRRLEMPPEMTAVWLGVGGAIIVVVLIACLILPRPGAEVGISQIPIAMSPSDLTPSWWSMGSDGKKEDKNARESSQQGSGQKPGQEGKPGQGGSGGGQKGEQGSGDSKQGKAGGKSKEGQGKSQQGESSGGQGKQGAQQQGQAGEKGGSEEQASKSGESRSQDPAQYSEASQGEQAASPSSSGAPSAGSVMDSLAAGVSMLLKLIFYALLLAVGAYFAWRYRRELMAAWQQLLAELRAWHAKWFGGRRAAANEAAAALPAGPPGFATFANPFANGAAGKANRAELVRYTFEAIQAWGRERGVPRGPQETPHEYVLRLSKETPELAKEYSQLAEFYGLAAYAGAQLPTTIMAPLQSLWTKLQAAI